MKADLAYRPLSLVDLFFVWLVSMKYGFGQNCNHVPVSIDMLSLQTGDRV